MARMAGMNPAAMPTKMAKTTAAAESQGGILDRLPVRPFISSRFTNRLITTEIP